MSSTSAHHPPTLVPQPPRTGRAGLQPGWTEIVVGIAAAVVITVAAVLVFTPARIGPTGFSVMLAGLSLVAAGGGFLAAFGTRIRSWAAFGVRRTTGRWLLIGLAGGLVAFVLKFPLISLYTWVTGDHADPQAMFSTAAGTGFGTLVAVTLLLGVLTPVGEEFLFRGVIATALLRYGAVVGVVGSALIFTVLHGEPLTMMAALPVGLIAAELRRRSGSVWPGVVLHVTFNVLGNILAFVVVPALVG